MVSLFGARKQRQAGKTNSGHGQENVTEQLRYLLALKILCCTVSDVFAGEAEMAARFGPRKDPATGKLSHPLCTYLGASRAHLNDDKE